MPRNQYEVCKGLECGSQERIESVWLRVGRTEQGVWRIQTVGLDPSFADGEKEHSAKKKSFQIDEKFAPWK